MQKVIDFFLVKIFYVALGLHLFCFCKPNVLQPLQQNSTADNGNNGTSSLQNGNTGNSNVSANGNASGNPNVSNDSANTSSPDSSDCSPIFPLKDLSHVLDFAPGTSRGFGDNRDKNTRAHAGCDLYAPVHTPIYAVCDGQILAFESFYLGTSYVEIKHPNFVARYGEVENTWIPGLNVNDNVKQGQQIATVGHCNGLPSSMTMVHFELYTGDLTGPLTVRSSTIKAPSGLSYQRRADLKNCYDDTYSWYTSAKNN